MFNEETKAVPPLLLFSNVVLLLHHPSGGLWNWGGPHVMCLIILALKSGLGEDSPFYLQQTPNIHSQKNTELSIQM